MPAAAHLLERLKTSPLPRKIYANPPIVEALVDIHIESTPPIGIEVLPRVYVGQEATYPIPESMVLAQVKIEGGTGKSETSTEPIGYRLFSAGRDSVVQVRTTGMAFSKLRPYSSWDEWKPIARTWWGRYTSVLQGAMVSRLAVRYINRIDIPAGSVRLHEYLTIYPATPSAPAMTMQNFAMRIEAPQLDMPDTTLRLQQGAAPPPSPNVSSILLDLDLSQTVRLDIHSEAIWDHLQALHDRENEIFESFITPRARALFD